MTDRIARHGQLLTVALAALVVQFASNLTYGAISYTINNPGGWPAQRLADTIAAFDLAVARYNDFGGFNKSINVQFNAGVGTADGNINGTIRIGPTVSVNERLVLHEIAHTLGIGTSGGWGANRSGNLWTGSIGLDRIAQFDGIGSVLNADGSHFWPYGLNQDNEGSEINRQRHVAMVYALQADVGLGPSDHPSSARSVTMIASDPAGESSFNRMTRWSDGYFPHSRPGYFTGDFAIRTPTGPNSYEFAGNFLSVNNTNGEAGGLIYQGTGSSAVITIDELYLDGGWIQHMAGDNDVFQLDGNLNVQSDSHLRAKQGNIHIRADITGDGDLTIHPADPSRQDIRYVRFLSANNSFVGNIENQSRFELAELANHTFVIGGPGENNAITGDAALSTALNGIFEFDLTGASSSAGDSWSLVTANHTTYGSTFNVAGFTNDGGIWSDGSYAFDQSTGVLAVIGDMAPLAGDYNDDGIVNAGDYVVWRNHNGTALDLPNRNPDTTGDISPGDYDYWVDHFGNTAGSGAASALSTAIPEPTSLLLAIPICALAFGRKLFRIL